VEFGTYIEGAITLVNEPVASGDDIARLLGPRPWLQARVRDEDVRATRRLQGEIAAIVDTVVAGDPDEAVRLLNQALDRHPITAQLAAHDESGWHLHVGDSHPRVPEVLAAEALFGLAVLSSQLGVDRLGRCVAPACGRAFVDTSANRSRRYCSTRCATRVNVATHRRKAAKSRPPSEATRS
jgi:predicted RNA-binding Zn ribbon-like protein